MLVAAPRGRDYLGLDESDQLASKGPLRHCSIATTQRHYIKDVPENTFSAMNPLEKFNDETVRRV